jgi:hypothetical protein
MALTEFSIALLFRAGIKGPPDTPFGTLVPGVSLFVLLPPKFFIYEPISERIQRIPRKNE